ncbi:sulfurtransferase TusA family protein [Rhodanobacter aciditrophus]|uniref:Sulfurtransferase TusA family protein n=1 Tax=Rhodanobacter aciditrophus TaxID=1623218 RepID=A0ABW4B3S8_9GAMM
MSDVNEYDVIVDAREERCPMPLLKMKLALAKMTVGECVCVFATDEGSKKDIPHYLEMVGMSLVDTGETDDSGFYFVVRKGE